MRPLRAADAPACDAITLSLPCHVGGEGGRQACARAVCDGAGLVAEADGRVIGYLTVERHCERAAAMIWMAGHAAHRRRESATR